MRLRGTYASVGYRHEETEWTGGETNGQAYFLNDRGAKIPWISLPLLCTVRVSHSIVG